MSGSQLSATLASATLLFLAACGQGDTDTSPAVAGSEPRSAAQTGEPAGTAGGPQLWRGGDAAPLDVQVAHPNGVVLQLTSLQSRETETVIGVRVINGDDREIDLNRFNNRNGYIVVESGERLYLSPPAVNTRLSVQPGQTLEGELIFLGRLPQTQNAVLVLNENGSTDNRHTNVPGFRIDLPLASVAQSGVAGS